MALTALRLNAPATGDELKNEQIKLLNDSDSSSWLTPKLQLPSASGTDKLIIKRRDPNFPRTWIRDSGGGVVDKGVKSCAPRVCDLPKYFPMETCASNDTIGIINIPEDKVRIFSSRVNVIFPCFVSTSGDRISGIPGVTGSACALCVKKEKRTKSVLYTESVLTKN